MKTIGSFKIPEHMIVSIRLVGGEQEQSNYIQIEFSNGNIENVNFDSYSEALEEFNRI